MAMKKWMLTGWLLAPVVVVAGLWLAVDRDAAKKSRANMAMKIAGGEFGRPAINIQPAKPAATEGPKEAAPQLVAPESLEQGFVLVVKDLAGMAKSDSPIHLASSHNGWDPGDKNQVLTSRSDLRWQIVMPKPKINAPLSFKFTRGNWDTAEVTVELADIDNRSLPKVDASKLAPGEKPVIEFEIPKWADQRPSAAARPDLNPYYTLNVTGTVKRLQVAGGGVATIRDLLVWLPAGYDAPENAARTYPVLYMQDGQNLFMAMPGTGGEWQADETATKLIASKQVEPFIIVGIPHAGKGRASEYLPIAAIDNVVARGEQYVDFLASEVMPRVERAFRVKTGPDNTAIGGASLGGVIALTAATKRPDLFGKVYMESSPVNMGSGPTSLMAYFAKQATWPPVVIFAMGAMELGGDAQNAEANAKLVDAAKEFGKLASSKTSGPKVNVQIVIDKNGEHNETAWARRFGDGVKALFPSAAAK